MRVTHRRPRKLHIVMTCFSQPTTFLMPVETSVDLFDIDDGVVVIIVVVVVGPGDDV